MLTNNSNISRNLPTLLRKNDNTYHHWHSYSIFSLNIIISLSTCQCILMNTNVSYDLAAVLKRIGNTYHSMAML